MRIFDENMRRLGCGCGSRQNPRFRRPRRAKKTVGAVLSVFPGVQVQKDLAVRGGKPRPPQPAWQRNQRRPPGQNGGECLRDAGSGGLECRVNVGSGCRIYFGRDGDRLIILLGGGANARRQTEIEGARALWQAYRRRKRQEV